MTSWFPGFGAPKSNLPAVTPLQAQRSKQIESLKNLNPNVVELKRDEEYRLTFTCGSNQVTFTILLPPEFPQAKPIITVAPPMRHGFLDESMTVVRYLPLINFNVQTDFGRMIQSLIQDFSKNPMFIQHDSSQQRATMATVPQFQHFIPQPVSPPQQLPPLQQPLPPHQPLPPPRPLRSAAPLPHQPSPPQHPSQMPGPHPGVARFQDSTQFLPQTQQAPPPAPAPVPSFTSVSSISPSSSSTSASTSTPPFVNGSTVEPNMPVPGMMGIRGLRESHLYAMPIIPQSFDDLLKDLNRQQLEEILEDKEKFESIYQQLPQLSKMLRDRAELYVSCEDISKLNLSYKPEVERLQRELGETLRFRNDLKNKFDMNSLQQQSLNEHCSLHHLHDNMRVAAADAEHLSDDLAERFMDDKITLEEFLKQFSEQRRLLHMRRVKEEKLGQLMSQSQGRY